MSEISKNNNQVAKCPLEYTFEEKMIMEQLAARVEDLHEEMTTAETLLRFIRARDCDIVKAEQMLRKSAKWFEENNVRSYRTGYTLPPALEKDYILEFLEYDDLGHVVIYCPLGRWNIRDRIKDGYAEDTLEGRFYLLEGQVMAKVRESCRRQFVVIVDLAELSFYKVAHLETANMVTKFFQEYEANYPEYLHSAYVINAPWVFPYAFGFVKPWLNPKTLAKVNVFNANKSKWLPALKANISNLPSYLCESSDLQI